MKRVKVLSVLVILAVALAGGLQAAALLPHVHGEDTDHSANPTCPVHLAQGHAFQAVESSGPALTVPAQRADAPLVFSSGFVFQTFLFQEFLRAPPASF